MKTQLMLLAVAAVLVACGGNAQLKTAADTAPETTETVDMHNAENSLDLIGVYKGTLPAADCPGIEETLILSPDGSYREISHYIDRDTFETTGRYTVKGNLLTVYPDDSEAHFMYRIEEGRLRQLDRGGLVITGPLADSFVLTKTE